MAPSKRKAEALLYLDKAISQARAALDSGQITDEQYAELKREIQKTYTEKLKGDMP